MTHRIDALAAPLLVTWQLTRNCDLACLHCCTESAPGKRMSGELEAEEAIRLARDIVQCEVPYVMLCGGEPFVVPHFFEVAEILGEGGVRLKIETNGQRFDAVAAERLARLPIRSVQISLDGDSEEVYRRQRPGGSLAAAHAACRAAHAAGLPLEITFAPTRLNIHEIGAVIERARALGAFRFNTGRLMRIGTAARLWNKIEPSEDQYRQMLETLERMTKTVAPSLELCYLPFSIEDGLGRSLEEPPATLLVLPDGRVKVAAALPHVCADLRRQSLAQAWDAYRSAWRSGEVHAEVRRAMADESVQARANSWVSLSISIANA
jgi:MoaA/NifB/PqqE/SkfB family radical SAM enzyme